LPCSLIKEGKESWPFNYWEIGQKPIQNTLDDHRGTWPFWGHTVTLATGRNHHFIWALTSRLPASVIVITPSRASDFDFTEEQPPRKTSPQQPHEARVGLCQTDDFSHRKLIAPILTISSEEEMCKTRAKEDHHDRTARHRPSSPQVQTQPQLRLHGRRRPTQRPVKHAKTRTDYQNDGRDQTITHPYRLRPHWNMN
jgi:hypothetical protein